MKSRLTLLFVSSLVAVVTMGCVVNGHRKLTIGFLGTEIVIEDEVSENDEGREAYRVGFDENSSVVAWLFGWLEPPPPAPEMSGSGD